jgi:hypothetical protein
MCGKWKKELAQKPQGESRKAYDGTGYYEKIPMDTILQSPSS